MTIININLTFYFSVMKKMSLVTLMTLGFTVPVGAQAQDNLALSPQERATYVDLLEMADKSELVIRAEIRRQARVRAERAPGLKPGYARLYIEADTLALIAGTTPIGGALVYLVDVPLDEKGKPPKLKEQQVILFANLVPGRPATPRGREIQLTSEYAQFDYTPGFEARLRPILSQLVARQQPPEITGIKDALAVQGTLVGESESQIFLETKDASPVSLTILRRPGQRPVWGVSWGEIIDSASRPPQPETMRWYRLACFLPDQLPSGANLARDPAARALAAEDYAFVVAELGPCARSLTRAPQ